MCYEECSFVSEGRYCGGPCAFEAAMPQVTIVINESHTLFPEQETLLRGYNVEVLKVPAQGWDLQQIKLIAGNLTGKQVIFASPVPALMSVLQTSEDTTGTHRVPFKVFHNSVREKKELPNGKIIQTVASTGWTIV